MTYRDVVEWVSSGAWRTHEFWAVRHLDRDDFPGSRESVPTVEVPEATDRGRFGGRYSISPGVQPCQMEGTADTSAT